MKLILSILIVTNLLFGALSRSGDIVSDDSTQLQWQDDSVVSTATRTWQEAIDYCENTLSLGGHEDWRLPNLNELTSIVDDTQYNPAIDSSISNGFQNTALSYYWTSTTYAGNTSSVLSNAWRVHFRSGGQGYHSKDNDNYVRCVRSGQIEPSTLPPVIMYLLD